MVTIADYGKLTTRCIAGAGAEIFFDVGTHSTELVAEQQANDSSLDEVFREDLTSGGGFSFVIAGGNHNEVWDQLMLRYGTVSSPTSGSPSTSLRSASSTARPTPGGDEGGSRDGGGPRDLPESG